MTVLHAGASVVGYELREDFAERATSNVIATLGPDAPYRVEIRDVTEGIDERDLDRILLDMPEPHKVISAAAAALRPGGILLAYLPTINQTALLRNALDDENAPFGLPETQEIMRRTWHIEATLRAAGPPHGGTHGVPHDRPPPQRLTAPAVLAAPAVPAVLATPATSPHPPHPPYPPYPPYPPQRSPISAACTGFLLSFVGSEQGGNVTTP